MNGGLGILETATVSVILLDRYFEEKLFELLVDMIIQTCSTLEPRIASEADYYSVYLKVTREL